jgi:hypothetical protein
MVRIDLVEDEITVDVKDDMAMVIGEPRLANGDVGLWAYSPETTLT